VVGLKRLEPNHHSGWLEGPSTDLECARRAPRRGRLVQRSARRRSYSLMLYGDCHSKGMVCTSTNLPESPPTIAIMPTNLDIGGADFPPPICKLVAGNIESGGRDQMIKNDRMLLSPAKPGNCI
jgi:hypothetical protein